MKNQPYTLPSGFTFPHFPYTENTLVRIRDMTNYKDVVDLEDKKKFSCSDFDHYFDTWHMVELELEPFIVMFKTSTLKKLGVNNPPSGWPEFHEECFLKKESDEILLWTKKKQIHNHLYILGLLVELQPTEELIENYLFGFTVAEIKEMSRRQGLKTTGNKTKLIDNIISDGKIKIPTFLTVSDKYWKMVHRLSQAYMQDIKKQLSNKPKIYTEAVNFLLEEDELLQAAMA